MKRRGLLKSVCIAAIAVQCRLPELEASSFWKGIPKVLRGYCATLFWYNEFGQMDSEMIDIEDVLQSNVNPIKIPNTIRTIEGQMKFILSNPPCEDFTKRDKGKPSGISISTSRAHKAYINMTETGHRQIGEQA